MKKFKLIPLLIISILGSCQNKQATGLKVGDVIDSLNGVYVYYNGNYGNVVGRNKAPDGYNLGIKYQCVEFVKRYYYYHLRHKMPNSYGNAEDFFNKKLSDGQYNKSRGLYQYSNPSKSKPQEDDLVIFKGNSFNHYGHVAIISKVFSNKVEIVQQNEMQQTRDYIPLDRLNNKLWKLENPRILGWLRK